MYKNIFSILVLALLFSCNNSEVDSSKNVSPQPKGESPKEQVKDRKFFAWVNDLRIRAIPNLKERKIASLSEGEEMTFLNEISKDSVEAKLRGRKIKAPFYKIKTKKGVEGWVFAGALSSDPVEVEGYSVAIIFEESPNYESDDVAVIMSNADSDLVGYGIQLMYVSDNFKSVKIRNSKGEIIGDENIMKYVKKHGTGVVCIKKSKNIKKNFKKFMFLDWDVGSKILKSFHKK